MSTVIKKQNKTKSYCKNKKAKNREREGQATSSSQSLSFSSAKWGRWSLLHTGFVETKSDNNLSDTYPALAQT